MANIVQELQQPTACSLTAEHLPGLEARLDALEAEAAGKLLAQVRGWERCSVVRCCGAVLLCC
jgi:hypothetical protein